tara:strand:+ start:430 stop:1962 length:1533 start_codon:yes stop_codon:yes gene_type:complete
MSEGEGNTHWLTSAGGWAASLGLVMIVIENAIGTGDSSIGSACCCFGIFGLIAGGIVSANGAAVSSDGTMVLKQDSTGQWNWVQNQIQGDTVGAASHFNDQNTQIMSRVISEVRNGKQLQDLPTNELDILASAYGVDSGSSQQKIEALHNSNIAKNALKLGALGVAGGAGAIGTAHIIKSSRERAIARAEELREQGREKLRENIEAGKYAVNTNLPTTESGEQATDVAGNIILDQLKKQIESRNLTPEKMLMMGDMNKDGRLDADEIAGALTAATGFSVPAFIVKDSMKDFDLNQDGKLDLNEMNLLWTKLGFEVDENAEFSDDEIDAVLDEVDDSTTADEPAIGEDNQIEATAEVSTEVEMTHEEPDVAESIDEPTVAEKSVHSTEIDATGEMSDEIDTEFERLLLEMEGARFSSERKALMEKQTSEFLVTLKIDKMERTLLGDPKYRGGQSVHGLLDGGPYIGVVKVPVELDEKILSFKEGDEIKLWASLVDFSPSLKRPVLESSEIV